jgi:HD-GYP domain-containing protein (c-di-GMP phosphodiesterase class II)
MEDVSGWVLAHHERPDGGGYPFGIGADEIPLEARILAVGDAYEAMTADRPYRTAPGHAYAVEELQRGVGTQFDGAVVDALLATVEVAVG